MCDKPPLGPVLGDTYTFLPVTFQGEGGPTLNPYWLPHLEHDEHKLNTNERGGSTSTAMTVHALLHIALSPLS